MDKEASIAVLLEQVSESCPAGFAAALHIKFTSPRYLFQSYRRDWIDYYSKHALVLRDPTVHWGFENEGAIRWSALTGRDTAGVMEKAAEYGLTYGFTAALEEGGSRSVASFARADREFTDTEISKITGLLRRLHDETRAAETLSPEDDAALKRLSIFLTRG